MSKHDPSILKGFADSMKNAETLSDKDLLDALNPTIIAVEKDDSYKTSAKLKIFLWISQLSNCEPRERKKYIRKISRKL